MAVFSGRLPSLAVLHYFIRFFVWNWVNANLIRQIFNILDVDYATKDFKILSQQIFIFFSRSNEFGPRPSKQGPIWEVPTQNAFIDQITSFWKK